MSTLNFILIIVIVFLILLYLSSKIRKNKTFSEVVKEIKEDVKTTIDNLQEAKSIIKASSLDNLIGTVIKKYILNVEKDNERRKENGESYLSGSEKKQLVITQLTDWVESIFESYEDAENYVSQNLKKIDAKIEDYISFNNEMINKIKNTNSILSKPELLKDDLS